MDTIDVETEEPQVNWQPVESKLFTAAAHAPEKNMLYLRFRSGDVYRYFEFTAQQYREFMQSESLGRYFLANIRHKFRYERLARLRAA